MPTTGSAELLERALGYALGALPAVEPRFLSRPTPCARWDLSLLLRHTADSLDAVRDGIRTGRVALRPDDVPHPPVDAVTAVRDAARRLLGASAAAGAGDRPLVIADRALPAGVLLGTGALELATHGWDIARACGVRHPIPAGLAADLLRIAPSLVGDAGRYPLFAAPVAVPPGGCPGDRLVAFLGRDPSG